MIPPLDHSIFISFLNSTIGPLWPIVSVVVGLWLGFRVLGMFLSTVSRPAATTDGDGDEEQDGD